MTDQDPRYSPDNKVRRPALAEEIRNAYAARNYSVAHAAFEDWWKLGDFEVSDTAFLSILGDLCNRTGDLVHGDLIEAHLAEHGTLTQCSRALRVLSRRWLGTPKQVQLGDVYRHALDRFPALQDDLEIESIGQKLAGFS
jgi:hypothetical protein